MDELTAKQAREQHSARLRIIKREHHYIPNSLGSQLAPTTIPESGAAGDDDERAEAVVESLFAAIVGSAPELLVDHLTGARLADEHRQIPAAALQRALDEACRAIAPTLPAELRSESASCIAAGQEALRASCAEPPSFLGGSATLAELANDYLGALLRGDRKAASEMILAAARAGAHVKQLYLEVFQPCLYEVGRLWQTNRITVAQEHYCTAATQLVMAQLYPYVFGGERSGRTLVATCVSGNLHEVGVRMVADFFEMAGWDTYFLGSSTPIDAVVEATVERKADLVGISATLGAHVSGVAELVDALRADPRCSSVKILAGGHPFNLVPGLASRIGADAFASSAEQAVAIGEALCNERT